MNEEARKREEEARRAYLEIEKAHTKIIKKAVKVSDAPKRVDRKEVRMLNEFEKTKKMFRKNGVN